MLVKEYCFIDDYIISNYICFMFLKAISEAIWMKMYLHIDTFKIHVYVSVTFPMYLYLI